MDIAIFGAGGLAEEVADICAELGYHQVAHVDKDGATLVHSGGLVVSEQEVYRLHKQRYHFVIAIGDSRIRSQIHRKFSNLDYVNIIHPDATINRSQKVELGRRRGNVVFAGARMTTNIILGNFGLYNQNCTIAHDCIIEDYVTIGPGTNISGNVRLSEGAYIGTGAVVLQGKSHNSRLEIGRYATVGAGAVVTRNVPDCSTVKGVPAR